MNIIFLNVSGHLGGAERILIDVLHSVRNARPEWRLEVIVGEEGPLIPTLMEAGFEVSVLPFQIALQLWAIPAQADLWAA